MRKTFLPFSPPLIGEEEIAEVVDTLRSDWITTGPKVERFEREFAAAVNAPAALAVNSCTAALHVALAALKIGPGDAVITTPLTFCSTVHVIEQVGARPILVDVEPGTLNLDPQRVREALEKLNGGRKKTDSSHPGTVKAILPVHLYGHPCNMDSLLGIASEYGLAVIEDAAHALPAQYKGQMVGSLGKDSPSPVLTAFSFYATKNMTTAEGGMLTGKAELLDRARVWSLHGMSRDAWKRYSSEGSWHYEVICPGFKCNMTDIQAAMGIHQLRKLPEFHHRRREIAYRYNRAFGDIAELETPPEESWAGHAWHLYVLRLNLERIAVSRDVFLAEMQHRQIGTSVHFIPVHLHAYYRGKYGYRPQDFPVAYAAYQRMLSLPCSPRMQDQDVEDVIEAVIEVVEKSGHWSRASQSLSAALSS
ncbi:MAG: DegT/DnrJ/EryC1/StrS aminotransferase family protein [Candidatus Sulfotelmatobacter sp.]